MRRIKDAKMNKRRGERRKRAKRKKALVDKYEMIQKKYNKTKG
jgi:hypothetical protein